MGRLLPDPQQVEGRADGEEAAEGREGLRHADHQQPPAARHELGDVVRVEAVVAADAEPHEKEGGNEDAEVGRRSPHEGRREHEQRAEAEEQEVAPAVAPPPEEDRADQDADEAARRDDALLQGCQPGVAGELDHRDDQPDEGREGCAGRLSERGDERHAQVAPAQRHGVQIDHSAVLAAAHVEEPLPPAVPALDHPQQRDPHGDAGRRLDEAQHAVRGGIDAGRHLRDEHDDEQRDGGDMARVVDVEQHEEHLEQKDRQQHADHREGEQREVEVGEQGAAEGAEDADEAELQRFAVARFLQDDDHRRAGQHGPHPARRRVDRPRDVHADQVGEQDADAPDDEDEELDARDGGVQPHPEGGFVFHGGFFRSHRTKNGPERCGEAAERSA